MLQFLTYIIGIHNALGNALKLVDILCIQARSTHEAD